MFGCRREDDATRKKGFQRSFLDLVQCSGQLADCMLKHYDSDVAQLFANSAELIALAEDMHDDRERAKAEVSLVDFLNRHGMIDAYSDVLKISKIYIEIVRDYRRDAKDLLNEELEDFVNANAGSPQAHGTGALCSLLKSMIYDD